MENEVWKDILGYEGVYQISDLGRVRSFGRMKKSCYGSESFVSGRFIKPVLQKKTGYCMVSFKHGVTQMELIHRVVAKCFILNPLMLPCVNHKNGIKTDNRAINLEWCTYQENNRHALLNGMCKNQMLPIVGTSISDGSRIRFVSITDAAIFLNGSRGNIHKCLKGINNRVISYGYTWEYDTHISHNLISKINSPINQISL
jgi:hypothetical protein